MLEGIFPSLHNLTLPETLKALAQIMLDDRPTSCDPAKTDLAVTDVSRNTEPCNAPLFVYMITL